MYKSGWELKHNYFRICLLIFVGMGVRRGENRYLPPPLEIGTKTQTFLARKRKISSLILAMTVCWPI